LATKKEPTPEVVVVAELDAARRQLAPEQRVRDLGQDAGAVAGPPVGRHGPAVGEVAERGEGVVEHLATRAALEGGDEADAAGVALVGPGRSADVGVLGHAVLSRTGPRRSPGIERRVRSGVRARRARHDGNLMRRGRDGPRPWRESSNRRCAGRCQRAVSTA
jgi:hypothetical protein